MLWRECADVGMPRAVVVTKLDHARADYPGVLAAAQAKFGSTGDKVLPLYVPVMSGHRGHRAGRAAGLGRRGRERRRTRRADRGDHRGVRGRGADGPLPRRRARHRGRAARGPAPRHVARHLLPRRGGLLDERRGLRRAARPDGARLPGAQRAPESGHVHARGSGRRPGDLRPPRSPRRRDRQDHQRPVRRPGQPGAGLLGHPRPRQAGARVRPPHVVLRRRVRPRRPRRRRARRCALPPLRSVPPAREPRGVRRHRHRRTARARGDRGHALVGRGPAGAPAVVTADAAAAGGDRGGDEVRRGQALDRTVPAGRGGPVAAGRDGRGRARPAGALDDGRGARGRVARAAVGAVRRLGPADRGRGAACARRWPLPAPRSGGT